ncbi:hypothetical protein ACXYRQ_02735 [Mycoplasma sp. 394]
MFYISPKYINLIKFPKWKYQYIYIIRSLIYTFFSLLIIKYIFSLVGGHFKFLYRSFIYSHKGYKSFWDGLDNTYIKNKILENTANGIDIDISGVKTKSDLYIKTSIIFKSILFILLLCYSILFIVIIDPDYNVLGILKHRVNFNPIWLFITLNTLLLFLFISWFFRDREASFNINDTFEKWIQNKYKDFFIKQKHDEEQEEYLKWKRPSEDEKL